MASHVMIMYHMRCMAFVCISNNKLNLDITDIGIHSKSNATLTLQDLMQVIVANMCANESLDLPSTLLTKVKVKVSDTMIVINSASLLW